MQEVTAHNPQTQPLPLLEEIRRGGKVGLLFRQAAGEQSSGTRQLLRGRNMDSLLQELMQDARVRQEAGKHANPLNVLHECAAGCNACCRASLVEVTPLEALAVAEHVKEKLSADELATLKLRLQANARQRFQWRRGEARGSVPACAFLGEDGKCQIYDARPLVCAGVFSYSRAACQVAVPGPSETNVPLDRETKAWTAGVSGGLQQALVAAGLDANLYELHSAVLCALETDQAFDRWWRKEDIFADCHCTDGHSFPRKAKLPKLPERAGTKWRIDRSHKEKDRKGPVSGTKRALKAKKKKRARR